VDYLLPVACSYLNSVPGTRWTATFTYANPAVCAVQDGRTRENNKSWSPIKGVMSK
jgi:hypothetical protein